MPKPRSIFACTACGAQAPRWLGRCPACGTWSSLIEESASPPPGARRSERRAERPVALRDVSVQRGARLATGIGELDRVLGGGLVPGSVVLLGGEPGIGKSTLALQAAARVRAAGSKVLYVTGEESAEQIRLRAERLAELDPDLLVAAETSVEAILAMCDELGPALVLVDSIQTLACERVESAAGSVAQVRESAAELAAAAKSSGAALFLVGHVTKEGTLAGPRVLEHLVDVVLAFEGDRGHAYRVLRAQKNRYGSTQEIGVFAMAEGGLEPVANPSELFLAERRSGSPGSCVVPLLEGTRPLLLEVQALVAPASYGTARRTAIGFDDGRLALLLAVLARRGGVDVLGHDVYVNVTGGVRAGEPAADLAAVLAIASSRLDCALPPDVAAIGELGLGGEVRRVGRIEPRVAEAGRLGFQRVLVPRGSELGPRAAGADAIAVADLDDAMAWLRAEGTPSRRSDTDPWSR
jgi:DNA repair protein RadA/Sms